MPDDIYYYLHNILAKLHTYISNILTHVLNSLT